jgi:hypothetical protein
MGTGLRGEGERLAVVGDLVQEVKGEVEVGPFF